MDGKADVLVAGVVPKEDGAVALVVAVLPKGAGVDEAPPKVNEEVGAVGNVEAAVAAGAVAAPNPKAAG